MKFLEEVWVTLQVEGIHHWPGCPFEEVAFLRDPHRHVFHVKAYKLVTHSDRDVEFIMLKRQIVHWFYSKYYNASQNIHVFGPMSCEMIAKELIKEFELTRCEVSEDGENGAIVSSVREYNVAELPDTNVVEQNAFPASQEKMCNICGNPPVEGCKTC